MPQKHPFRRKGRELLPNHVCELNVINADGTGKKVIYAADEIMETPNWSPDGKWIYFNAGAELWRISVDGGSPTKLDIGDLEADNIHCLSPDGKTMYFTALPNAKGRFYIHAVPTDGGKTRQISNDPDYEHHCFVHGISPDGKTLLYVGVLGPEGARVVNLFNIPTAGGRDTQMSDVQYPIDCHDFSFDGKWIYFSSERNATCPGHAQCYRMRPDGSGLEQLTTDDRVNWFPHPSPDGKWVNYLSYPPGTTGHPPDKQVFIRMMKADGSDQHNVVSLNGGTGTMNLNSWSPDSKRFAFMDYRKKA